MSNTGTVFGVSKVVGLNYQTKRPIFSTELLTSMGVNDAGELVAQRAGRVKYPLGHYESEKSCEIQFTGKEYSMGLVQACTGHKITNIDSSANQVETLDSKNANLVLAIDGDNTSSLFYGTYAIVYNATSTKWDIYLLDDSVVRRRLAVDTNLNIGDVTIAAHGGAGGPVHIGIGLTAILAENYVPADGDYQIIQIFPTDADATAAYIVDATEDSRRPYISLVVAAESQANLKSIYIPKVKCSSGFPHNFNENTANEYQITFMASLTPELRRIFKIQNVERES